MKQIIMKQILEREIYLFVDMYLSNYQHTSDDDAINWLFDEVRRTHSIAHDVDVDAILGNEEWYDTAINIINIDPYLIKVEDPIQELVLKRKFVRHVFNPMYSFYSHSNYFNTDVLDRQQEGAPYYHHSSTYFQTSAGRLISIQYDEGYNGIVHVEYDDDLQMYDVFTSTVNTCVLEKQNLLRILSQKEIDQMPGLEWMDSKISEKAATFINNIVYNTTSNRE